MREGKITQGISEEIGEIPGDKIESIRSRVEPSAIRYDDTPARNTLNEKVYNIIRSSALGRGAPVAA